MQANLQLLYTARETAGQNDNVTHLVYCSNDAVRVY